MKGRTFGTIKCRTTDISEFQNFEWGTKFGMIKCKTTDIPDFQNYEY